MLVETSLNFVCLGCGNLLHSHACICPACFRSGLVSTRYRRPMDELRPSGRVLTAKQLLTQTCRVFSPSCYPKLKMSRPCFLIVYGPSGAGKTGFLLKLADALAPSTVLPIEMGAGSLLADYCRRLEIASEAIRFVEVDSQSDVASWAENAGTLVIDSLSASTLTPADIERITRGHHLLTAGSLHVTKDGLFKGDSSWVHACDVCVHVEDRKWSLEKSRYQPVEGIGGSV